MKTFKTAILLLTVIFSAVSFSYTAVNAETYCYANSFFDGTTLGSWNYESGVYTIRTNCYDYSTPVSSIASTAAIGSPTPVEGISEPFYGVVYISSYDYWDCFYLPVNSTVTDQNGDALIDLPLINETFNPTMVYDPYQQITVTYYTQVYAGPYNISGGLGPEPCSRWQGNRQPGRSEKIIKPQQAMIQTPITTTIINTTTTTIADTTTTTIADTTTTTIADTTTTTIIPECIGSPGCSEVTVLVNDKTFTYCMMCPDGPTGACEPGERSDSEGIVTVITDYKANAVCDYCAQSCQDKTAITLASFSAKAGNQSVTISWQTGIETNNVGFNIYRAESENGQYKKINQTLIPAKAVAGNGASYEYVDNRVKNRKTYYYKLEDIDLSDKATLHDAVATATPRLWFAIFGK